MKHTWVQNIVIAISVLVAMTALISSSSIHRGGGSSVERARIQEGDDLAWKEADFDDSQWQSYRGWQIRICGTTVNISPSHKTMNQILQMDVIEFRRIDFQPAAIVAS